VERASAGSPRQPANPVYLRNEVKAVVDKAGRVALPEPALKEMNLAPGDEFRIDHNGQTIMLRPLRMNGLLKKEFGIWVYQGRPSSQSIPRFIDTQRKERLRNLLIS